MAAFHSNLTPRVPLEADSGSQTPPRTYPGTGLLEINFYRSHKGLLAGLVVFAAMCVSVILSYSYFDSEDKDEDKSLLIFLITDLSAQGILIIASVINWIQIRNLSFASQRPLHMDPATLIVSFIASFLFLLLRVVPLLTALAEGIDATESILDACSGLLALILGIIQTSFIVDAFHREATSRWVKKELPGRGTCMFLLIANLGVWMLRTVYISEVSGTDSQLHMYTYGQAVWTFMVQALWPWLLFYHFQATVCLAHIWTTIYRPQIVTRLSRQPSKAPPSPVPPSVETADMGTQVKVIELKRKVKDEQHPNGEMQTVLSPVSEV